MKKLSKISLQTKIIAGYLILLAVIGSMIAILFHEREKMHDIENGTTEIRNIRNEVNSIRRQIIGIALMGESAIGWEQKDLKVYKDKRLHIDSLLIQLKLNCRNLVSDSQIDTLRRLLKEKEDQLFHIKTVFRSYRESDSLIYNRLPEVIRKTSPQTITRKKSGIAGFFGKKETVQIPVSTDELKKLNRQLISIQEEHDKHMELYIDSLRLQNLKLNRKLNAFIADLDRQVQIGFQQKEAKIGIIAASCT